jgi:hypothetical protein
VLLSQALVVLARADALRHKLGLESSPQTLEVKEALQEALRDLFRSPVPPLHISDDEDPDEALKDALAPSEWDPEPADATIAAEQVRTLLTDIIRRAAHDWVLYRTSSRLDQKELAYDAYVWLFEEDEDHPNWALRKREGRELTSFLSICEIIDVDPDFARQQIKKLTARDVKTAGRPPERRHRQSLDTTYYVEHSVLYEPSENSYW